MSQPPDITPVVLFVDDEEIIRLTVRQTLELAGLAVTTYPTAEAALADLSVDTPGILVTDVRLPGMSGLDLLSRARALDAELPVVLVTGQGDISMAVRAMQDGAYDFIEKPFVTEHFVEVIRRALEKRALVRENRRLREALERNAAVESNLLGQSPALARVRRLVTDLAGTDVDVLVLGETGTGKEQVARALHEGGPRAAYPFVAINCGAIPESMFESEMFGHEAGAFTGAAKRRVGKIEYAHRGTLFLDEIESMPPALQVKLLRVLQDRALERLGGNDRVAVDLRVVAATKENLLDLANAGRFRADLYYRLNVVSLTLPPLRERREDIPLLFQHFALQAAARFRRPYAEPPAALLRALMLKDWPGNVRELRNAADRHALGLTEDEISGAEGGTTANAPLADILDGVERHLITEALRASGGQVTRAAETLGVPRKTLYDKMKRLNIGGAE
ncbi:sigma-54-dependent transcriptional regulator [Nitrospirillum pindoramense]|uniref:Two-component system C4-dicarboxylate transport response regulator DctD n=1 Tax=Nitrospirillum amazonense TaxID=28077 RepID=A0A560H263_9PROT|nr:sigma-54 dependent transcriptional regulator [Nitrospirillum amazonense]TWB39710.1 two-component system C4-dicarboxylate transport response regulator DctD [Nitrospirillum amazonense]